MAPSLLDQMRDFQTTLASEAQERNRESYYSRDERVRRDLKVTGRFLRQFAIGIGWIWKQLALPALRAFKVPTRMTYLGYRRLWAWWVYRKDPYGALTFSKARAGSMILATGFFLWFLVIPLIELTFDAGLYALTVRHGELMYLFSSQELDPTTQMHSVRGVEGLPWSDRDAIYFRTENTWFNNLWSLIHGRGLYFPEYVAAAVPSNVTRCAVTSYGLRIRFFMRYVNVFPKMLSVSCSG